MRDPVRSVLVLDEDSAARDAVRVFFEDAGWRVLSARRSRHARALLIRTRPDLLIVDARSSLLRSADPALLPPLVLLTPDPARAGAPGALGVLAKPVRLAGLLELYERIERAGLALV